MSMFISIENKIISFRDYCLSESIAPKQISYGSDLKNGKILIDDPLVYTFFEYDNKFYSVMLANIHYVSEVGFKIAKFGFGVSDEFSTNLEDYTDSRTQTRNALRAFNHVMYVGLQIANEKGFKGVTFSAANPALGKVYTMLVKNKVALDSIKNSGYTYVSDNHGDYIFIRNELL